MEFIESHDQLRAVFGTPSELAVKKQMPRLDVHAKAFLAKSPIVMIGSQDRAGHGDVTPKGDRPGFVQVLDDDTIAIPDRPGNNRLDTWMNLVENSAIGLLFMIPGMNETLRINGTARLTVDAGLCERLGMNGRPAKAVVVVAVTEVYMHCAKAYIRSELWKPETWPARGEMPTLGEMLRDQLALSESAGTIDDNLAKAYQKTLW
ncbi:MAG: pyridoxamine 5'-phosphate oxidase family protein [Pseudooceanicola sp.]|nr:pyridoxamine 5'-phosphate oxidase family protein [Pseudooceanicola sp.]